MAILIMDIMYMYINSPAPIVINYRSSMSWRGFHNDAITMIIKRQILYSFQCYFPVGEIGNYISFIKILVFIMWILIQKWSVDVLLRWAVATQMKLIPHFLRKHYGTLLKYFMEGAFLRCFLHNWKIKVQRTPWSQTKYTQYKLLITLSNWPMTILTVWFLLLIRSLILLLAVLE